MSYAQFYKADELVELIHQNVNIFGVFHPGFRAVHGYGRFYTGTFTATPEAKTLSRAIHFQGTPVPVTARLSYSAADPTWKSNNIVAMATRFYLPNGTFTNIIGITLPAFPARTPDEVIELLTATRPDPATGKADPAKVQAFLVNHPAAVKVAQLVGAQLAPVSLAQTSFRPLHAFRFINEAGEGRWARYHWEPEAGETGQPTEELVKQPHDYLFDEFEARLKQGAVTYRLDLQLAEDGDPVDDISAIWPDDRQRITIGRLELVRPITLEEIGDPVMNHDPSHLTDGIEVSPDDQIIAARRGLYLSSVTQRTGGWQKQSSILAQNCPFHPTTAENDS